MGIFVGVNIDALVFFMPLDSFPIRDIPFTVGEVHRHGERLFEVLLHSEDSLPPFKPGQFAQIKVAHNGAFLRRPISIYKYVGIDTVSFLIQDVGQETHRMCEAHEGDVWQVLMPLGNSFPMPTGDKPLLVGGGVGVAPLLSLAGKIYRESEAKPTILLGARGKEFFPDLKDFNDVGEVFLTTEDGSLGEQGFVTDHSVLDKEHFTDLYTCGPTPMMKAIARWAKTVGIPAYASLENVMGCGMGVCLCCVEPTVGGHKTVCNDGPVFETSELLWD